MKKKETKNHKYFLRWFRPKNMKLLYKILAEVEVKQYSTCWNC